MCPFCFASLALAAAGAASAGGLTALAVKLARKGNQSAERISNSNARSDQDVNQVSGTTEGSLAG
jgi:hypothetical protein